jgi:hypothetical protein
MRTRKKSLVTAVLFLGTLIALAIRAFAQEPSNALTPRQVFVVNTQDASVSFDQLCYFVSSRSESVQ